MAPDLFPIPGPWRGKLFVSTRPRGGDWLADEVEGWKRAGLNAIVSLLEHDEAKQLELSEEERLVLGNGLAFLPHPVPDRGVPGSAHDFVVLLRQVAHKLDEGKNVAVHCRQGIGRSGLVAAGVLMTYGTEPRQAMEIVSKARGIGIPETPEQLRWAETLPSELFVER